LKKHCNKKDKRIFSRAWPHSHQHNRHLGKPQRWFK